MDTLGITETIGPIQMGLNKPIHFTDVESSTRDIVNLTTVAVVDAIVQEQIEKKVDRTYPLSILSPVVETGRAPSLQLDISILIAFDIRYYLLRQSLHTLLRVAGDFRGIYDIIELRQGIRIIPDTYLIA